MDLDSSPFQRLLHTNYVPSPEETIQIRALCATPLEELTRLGAEIEHTLARLHDLQRSYRQLKESIDAHMSLLAPMRSLPPELLQSIFFMTLPSERNAVMHASEAPVLLCRICSGWRRLAFATPKLWASIHVVIPPVDYSESVNSPGDVRRFAMEEWLARTGACPLYISIYVSQEAWKGAAAAAASPFVEAILSLANRWKHIELRVPADSLDSLHYLVAADVPLLQTLSISNGSSLARDDWSGNLLFLQHAPQLHTLSLTHDGNVVLPPLPWGQLTSLSMSANRTFFNLDVATILSTLSLCSALRRCRLHFPRFPRNGQPPPNSHQLFSLSNLDFLSVTATSFYDNDRSLFHIFERLVLPNLQTLELEDRNGDLVIFSALSGLLTRSKCHLRNLKLVNITTSPSQCINLFSLPVMNDLNELTVRDRYGDEDESFLTESFFETMANSKSICPNLRTIRLKDCTYCSDKTLFAVLQARSGGLELADISFAREADSDFDVDATFRELSEGGLKLHVGYENDDFWDPLRVSPWEGVKYP
ncbi:hypothetical protein R3P38DRAFT_2908793 [Favolaschia claudopus]|uniref:F-box domain-containing protein n=1 Tax=Favolaschia claudopus TaxID=2862362 RepID=A0AAW0C993_9AGAR